MPPHSCFVKGDAKVASIAASILAKTHRDAYMLKAIETYPNYGWQTNMGYPTIPPQKGAFGVGSDATAPCLFHLGAT